MNLLTPDGTIFSIVISESTPYNGRGLNSYNYGVFDGENNLLVGGVLRGKDIPKSNRGMNARAKAQLIIRDRVLDVLPTIGDNYLIEWEN